MDLLSRSLDGAGPLRTVPPTTVIRRWRGRADLPSAIGLGQRTRAGLLVFGSLIGTGPDSVRLTVTALDVDGTASDRRARAPRCGRPDGSADRLAHGEAAAGAGSHPAERGVPNGLAGVDLAAGAQGVPPGRAMVPAGGLGLRPRLLRARDRAGQHVPTRAQARRAGAGLAAVGLRPALPAARPAGGRAESRAGARETACWSRPIPCIGAALCDDSAGGLVGHPTGPRDRAGAHHAATPTMSSRGIRSGEARYHFGSPVGSSPRQALEAFDRAIALDSSFAPAYIHPVELALWLDGPEAARPYASNYLALGPTGVSASGMRVDRADHGGGGTLSRAEIRRLLRDASPDALDDAWLAIPTLRRTRAKRRSRWRAHWRPARTRMRSRSQEQASERRVGIALLSRGHVGEAATILFQSPGSIPPYLVEAALLSARRSGQRGRRVPPLAVGGSGPRGCTRPALVDGTGGQRLDSAARAQERHRVPLDEARGRAGHRGLRARRGARLSGSGATRHRGRAPPSRGVARTRCVPSVISSD